MNTTTLKKRLLEVAARLEQRYGDLGWNSASLPLDVLVETILSHNTTDHNRDIAYRALKAAYPSWQALVEAPCERLAEVIRPAGLNHQKAERIQTVLRTLYEEQGAFTLDPLHALSRDEALAALTRFVGVGKKTAGIVLTFALDKPYFPVDTHIKRITRRLGWVKQGQDPHEVMNALTPLALIKPFHLQLIQHGRDTCKARKPLCGECLLSDLCPAFGGEVPF